MINVDIKNHGFIAPEITPDQYILGGGLVPQDILQESGQWDSFLPQDEFQLLNGLEVYNCTAFGTLNAIELLARRKFDEQWNKSERFVGTMAGTRPPGNSPHVVCETVRKTGLIDDELLPFSAGINTLDEYYSTLDITNTLLAKAENWLLNYQFKHEWLWYGFPSIKEKQDKLVEALKYSPIGASVNAWKEESGLYYKDTDDQDNHWICIYGYELGKYWKIFDSYNNSHKKLAWDYNFLFAKRFHLQKNDDVGKNWLEDILARLLDFLKSVLK